jgi:hypothetical protein
VGVRISLTDDVPVISPLNIELNFYSSNLFPCSNKQKHPQEFFVTPVQSQFWIGTAPENSTLTTCSLTRYGGRVRVHVRLDKTAPSKQRHVWSWSHGCRWSCSSVSWFRPWAMWCCGSPTQLCYGLPGESDDLLPFHDGRSKLRNPHAYISMHLIDRITQYLTD